MNNFKWTPSCMLVLLQLLQWVKCRPSESSQARIIGINGSKHGKKQSQKSYHEEQPHCRDTRSTPSYKAMRSAVPTGMLGAQTAGGHTPQGCKGHGNRRAGGRHRETWLHIGTIRNCPLTKTQAGVPFSFFIYNNSLTFNPVAAESQ